MDILELGLTLLKELKIHKIYLVDNHLELRYECNNQAVIAFGKTQDETIINFYENYQILIEQK